MNAEADTSKLAAPPLAGLEVKGITRGAFILRSALAAGAVYGGSVVGPFVSKSLAQTKGSPGDIAIIEFALTLETLEQTFYQQALRRVNSLRRDVQALAEELESNEANHVAELRRLLRDLGADLGAAGPGEFFFGDAFKDEGAFLQTAEDLEDVSVAAYNGAAPDIESPDVLAEAASIVQTEGRHAALVRRVRKVGPALTAFDMALDLEDVREFIEPFVVSDREPSGGPPGGDGR